MDSSTMLLLVLFLLPLISIQILQLSVAQPDFAYQWCSDSGNFSRNSSYQTNLNLLLSSLPSDASRNGFSNASIGENPDRVTVTALCRGDIRPDTCRSCVNDSVLKLPQICPNRKEAIGGYVNCMLRYSNRSIVGTEDTSLVFLRVNRNNVSSDLDQFSEALGNLMYELRARAASRKFATGSANATSFQRIYGLVQCTPDLSEVSCNNCLENLIRRIPDCCAKKIGARVVAPSCNLRFELKQFFEPESTYAPPPEASSTNTTGPATTGEGSNTTRTVIAVVIPTVSVMLIIVICFFLQRRKRWKKLESVDEIGRVESVQFDFSTIRAVTDNFSDANKLGQGGFGAVYKGRLPDGQEIAVKRLSIDSGQGEQEFKNEVQLVARLQHRNLVRLFGFSLRGKERLLIYEFVPNTSLDHFIFHPVRRSDMNWETRHKIIGGIGRGLLYLHEDSRLRIIHRDLKASNILLDGEMNPKIADFGMARLFQIDQTQGNTNRIVGTYGYMAPEYALHGLFSVKSDVFSFGVLVLEIVTGQKNFAFRDKETGDDLLTFAWKNWRAGTASELIDPTLGNGSRRDTLRCMHIGLLCVQDNEADRPTMASVVLMLNSHSITLPVPLKPAYVTASTIAGPTRNDHSRSKFMDSSNNGYGKRRHTDNLIRE